MSVTSTKNPPSNPHRPPVGGGGQPMLWSGLESVSLAGVSVLVLAMLARHLDPDDFGRAAIALGVVQIACSFVESVFHNAIVQRKDLQPGEIDAAHSCGLLMAALLVAGIGIVGGFAIAGRPADAGIGVAELALAMSPSVLLAAASAMAIAQLRRRLAMRSLAIAMIGSRVTAGMAALAALNQGAGVWAVVVNQNLAALVLLALLAAQHAPRAHLTRHLGGVRRLVRYASWNSASSLINANLARFFQVACGFVLPAAVVGQLALALRIVEMLVAVLVTGVSRVSLPQLATAAHEGRDAAALYMRTTRRLCFLMMPALVLVAVLAEPLVRWIARAGWEQAAGLVAWFALAQALRSPTYLAGTLFLGLGHARMALAVSMAELASLALLAALMQSPLAWAARLAIVLPLLFYMLHTRFGIGVGAHLLAVCEPAAAAAAMGALLHGLLLPALATTSPAPFATLVLGTLSGALVYGLVAVQLLGTQRITHAWRDAFLPEGKRS